MKLFTWLAALGLAFAAPAQAVTYSLSGDWSDAANPNGPWSYGPGLSHYAQPSDGNAFNTAAGNGYWGAGANFLTSPFMVKTTANGSAAAGYTDGDFLIGDVVVHSANSGAPTIIAWTAPDDGVIALTSSVWYAHSIVARSDEITAFLNATSLGSTTVTNGITRANQLTLANGSFAVAAGDVLTFNFIKSAGQQFGSIAGISATIDFTPRAVDGVPEPATWLTMILGLGLIGAAMRSRRQALAIA